MADAANFFLPYQVRWIEDESPLKCAEKARRVGFTFATSYRAVQKCLTRPRGFVQWVSSTDMATAKEFVGDYVRKWARVANIAATDVEGLDGSLVEVLDLDRDIQAFVVNFRSTGNRIMSVSSNPAAYAGKGGDVMLDEMDVRPNARAAFDMAAPCIDWGGQLEMFSAYDPEGSTQTFFAQHVKAIREGRLPGWSFHRVTIEDAIRDGLVEKINAVSGQTQTRAQYLAKLRAKQSSEAAWQAQYLCNAQDEGGALLPFRLIMAVEMSRAALAKIAADNPDAPRFAGFDVARRRHKSAWWELLVVGDVAYTCHTHVMTDAPFDAQEAWISERLRAVPQIRRLCVDETGLGMMLAERLRHRFGSRVEAVNFSKCQVDLGMRLYDEFDTRRVRVPDEQPIRVSLNTPRKAVTTAGNMRIVTDETADGHADEFWALALANHARNRPHGPTFIPREFEAPREEAVL
jgi:phage FluMu gp28-like protein